MHIPKKYLRDKLVLLLLTASVFLAVLSMSIVFLLGATGQNVHIIQYHASLGDADSYKPGSIYQLLSFAVFSTILLAVNTCLSIRVYSIRRSLSLVVLSLGALTLVFAAIVSYALLRL